MLVKKKYIKIGVFMNTNTNLEYAVYVTAGKKSYSSKFEWGGCHITVAGFTPSNGDKAKLLAASQIGQNALDDKKSNQWKPVGWTVKNWKNVWTIVIKSSTLDKVADMLSREGFENLKGPNNTKNKTPFHISVPHAKTKEDAEKYGESLAKKRWFITIAQRNAANEFEWIQYSPLNKV